MSTLHDALGAMRQIGQWFVWRLEWDKEEGKYRKTPCYPGGGVHRMDASLPANWMTYEAARNAVASLPSTQEIRYALGFWMTSAAGYWFLDIDRAVDVATGVMNPFAQQMLNAFPGVLTEFSSSGKGLHLIGRGPVTENHRTRPMPDVRAALAPLDMEFYHKERGIAFGLDGAASGNADVVFDMTTLCERYFPPGVQIDAGEYDQPRADWNGPTDDDALIARALAARSGAGVVFGGKASFGQLWRGEVELTSEHDMALASHLAFWTGCDAPRIERLMRASGMAREKWNEHRTYLRELTIARACATCEQVYREPERNTALRGQLLGPPPPPPPAATPGSTMVVGSSGLVDPVVMEMRDKVLDAIAACGTEVDFWNTIPPMATAAGIPKAFQEAVVRAALRKLDFWDAKIPIGEMRTMLFPPADGASVAPEWVHQHCYVKENDKFYNTVNGSWLTAQGFVADFGRLMPMADGGRRHNPVEWALHKWGMVTVHKAEYRPDQPGYFQWDGLDHVNKYNPSNVPVTATEWTDEGKAGIEAFKSLLWDMCDRREPVYNQLLFWLARNVQVPGKIIGWAPVVKGCQGDGKSILGVLLRETMGWRNVGVTGNSTLTNEGGFNDWASGYAVNVIEEVMITGKERHRLYNAMKEFITNQVCGQNAKGEKNKVFYNTTNHLALSNHNNAIPLERDDRRWMVVFTPWSTTAEMLAYSGLTKEDFQARFDTIDYAMRERAGELRAWFLSIDTSGLRGRASAPWTTEKSMMFASSRDDAESVIAQIIEDGAYGVSKNVLSSSCLHNLMKIKSVTEAFDLPKTSAWNHLLVRAGFSQLPKPLWFDGKVHRIWVRNGFKGDPVEELVRTKTQKNQ